MVWRDAEAFGEPFREGLGVGDTQADACVFFRDQRGIAPDRLAVATPIEPEGQARQGFARLRLALPVMQQAAGREALVQPPDEPVRETGFVGPSGRPPLGGLESSTETKVGSPPRVRRTSWRRGLVDLFAERIELAPASSEKGS